MDSYFVGFLKAGVIDPLLDRLVNEAKDCDFCINFRFKAALEDPEAEGVEGA